MKFEAKPNIAYLRGMFRDLFRTQGYTNNNSSLDWDWSRIDAGAGGAVTAGGERERAIPGGEVMQGYAADNMQGQMGGDFQQRGTSRG